MSMVAALTDRKPFWAICKDSNCRHCWAPAWAPMEAALFARIAAAGSKYCPLCGAKGAFVAKQEGSLLLEPGYSVDGVRL